ncbi:hypothetical protein CCHL11_00008 [Colletotrichum chlorophyti]|uniref:Uncharacterized protein n=1 Tax=Colletotrichum chlorophyti TaxID=708187 RepID=A0A1Q8RUM7_9PEZI|nr:hypothetical protein CCHL11_00008 [Colletotrichum chlorophyti]
MSRNVRNKSSAASRKAAKRRDSVTSSSSFDLSDDGGYSAVEDISDSSDDDEEDVDAVEEEHILHEVLPTPSIPSSPRPPIVQQEEDDDDDDDEEEQEHDEDEEDGAADVEDSASWDGIMSDVDESAASDHHRPEERHVRFDVPSSDSDSTDTEDDHADFFPDIFVDQSSLDPAFRREIENDDENDESENSNSFWDYHGDYHGAYGYPPDDADSDIEAVIQELGDDDTPIATPLTTGEVSEMPTPVAAFEETQELDGYETDGDTTEEDEPEPVVRRKIKRPELPSDQWDDSDTDHPVKGERGQPRVGRFNLDSSERKPVAVLNPITRKMMIFTPHRRRHLDLSPEQFNFQYLPTIDENQNSPMLSNSAQIMMSAMFSSNTFGDYLNTQAMGPAEAFFPFTSEPNTADESSDVGFDEDEEDDVERSLNISDFIEFDDRGSSGDEGEGNQWDGDLMNSPARPRTASSDVDLHSHINASNVGAFRRDQINQRLILSDKATQDSLALSSPYNYTALRGLKSDRFETAAVPLTPLRRTKKQLRDLARSPLESMSQKRKASSEIPVSHKRQRSISDVNLLRI